MGVSAAGSKELLGQVKRLCADGDSGGALQRVCILLKEQVPGYDWVGFYFAVPEERRLILGPFEGEPTEHLRIRYGRGICGQAAERETSFRVDDVASQSNYLSCSLKVKSEIVLPVFRHGKFVAELDLDSHTGSTFTEVDERFLTNVAELCSAHAASLAAELRDDEQVK